MVHVSCTQPDNFTKVVRTRACSFRSSPTTKRISPIPGEPYTFSILKQAQALGDFRALAKRGRRVIGIDLGDQTLAGLDHLHELIGDVA